MIKRLGVLGAVAALVALPAGAVAPAAGSSGGEHDVISVIEIVTEEDFVDVGAPGFSLGDQFVFGGKLMKHGKAVGHDGGVCTITSVQREESQCAATAWFRRGQITVQGLVAGEPERFVLPITGGSGAYESAQGELHVHQMADKAKLVFMLSD